jgi:hypothetical protein
LFDDAVVDRLEKTADELSDPFETQGSNAIAKDIKSLLAEFKRLKADNKFLRDEKARIWRLVNASAHAQ